jgi:hypothetical protein
MALSARWSALELIFRAGVAVEFQLRDPAVFFVRRLPATI